MPFTGPTYEIPAGTLNPAVVGTPISADDWNAFITDLEAAMTDTLRATTQAFVGQVYFDDTANAATPAIAFTADTDTGIFQKGANELGLAAAGSEIVLVTTTGVEVTGDLDATGYLYAAGDIGTATDLDVAGNALIGGTLEVTGTSIMTGRVTLGAGIAGILPTDLPTTGTTGAISVMDNPSGKTVITGDVAWHAVILNTDAFTTIASSTMILSVGPGLSQDIPLDPASTVDDTGFFLDIDSGGATGPGFLRLIRTSSADSYVAETEIATQNVIFFQGGGSTWALGGFTTIDQPGAGTFKYRVDGRVSDSGLTMTVYCARLKALQIG